MTAVRVNANLAVEVPTMKITIPKLRKVIRTVLTESSKPREGMQVEVHRSKESRQSGVPDYIGTITNVISKMEDFHRSYILEIEEERDGTQYYQKVPAYQVREVGAKYFLG